MIKDIVKNALTMTLSIFLMFAVLWSANELRKIVQEKRQSRVDYVKEQNEKWEKIRKSEYEHHVKTMKKLYKDFNLGEYKE